jgi:hypothetical protein
VVHANGCLGTLDAQRAAVILRWTGRESNPLGRLLRDSWRSNAPARLGEPGKVRHRAGLPRPLALSGLVWRRIRLLAILGEGKRSLAHLLIAAHPLTSR